MPALSLKSLARKKILNDMLGGGGGNEAGSKEASSSSGFRILVTDTYCLSILNSVCLLQEIQEANILAVEDIANTRRKPHSNRDAIYFFTPSYDNIARLKADFPDQSQVGAQGSQQQPPIVMYSGAHIYCLSGIPDQQMAQIKHSQGSLLRNYIRSLTEINLDFFVLEPQVFECKAAVLYKELLFSNSLPQLQLHLAAISKSLVSVLYTLGDAPVIRYYNGAGARDHSSLSAHLALQVYHDIEQLKAMDKSFPPPTPYKKKTRLIILDRSIDKITPLMHDIGYQSLVHELMHVEHDKIHYISKPSDDGEEEEAEKLCVMNDADEVWMRLRHEFVAKAFQRIGEDMKEFKKEYPDTDMLGSSGNSSSGSSGNTKTTASLDKLKELIFTAPEFLRRKQLLTNNLDLLREIDSLMRDRQMKDLTEIEQIIVTGEDEDGDPLVYKLILGKIKSVLQNEAFGLYDKIRLFMIFSLCLKEPSDASLDALWLEYIANSEDEEDANSILDGMRKMGLGGLRHCDEMMTSRYSGKSVKQAARNNKKIKITTSPPEGEEDKKESPFFRYHPILKYLIENEACDAVDTDLFPFVNPFHLSQETLKKRADNPKGNKGPGIVYAMNHFRPTWPDRSPMGSGSVSARQDWRRNGPRLVFFVLGGMTMAEIREVYKVSEMMERDVYIGSTHVIDPELYLEEIQEVGEVQEDTVNLPPIRLLVTEQPVIEPKKFIKRRPGGSSTRSSVNASAPPSARASTNAPSSLRVSVTSTAPGYNIAAGQMPLMDDESLERPIIKPRVSSAVGILKSAGNLTTTPAMPGGDGMLPLQSPSFSSNAPALDSAATIPPPPSSPVKSSSFSFFGNFFSTSSKPAPPSTSDEPHQTSSLELPPNIPSRRSSFDGGSRNELAVPLSHPHSKRPSQDLVIPNTPTSRRTSQDGGISSSLNSMSALHSTLPSVSASIAVSDGPIRRLSPVPSFPARPTSYAGSDTSDTTSEVQQRGFSPLPPPHLMVEPTSGSAIQQARSTPPRSRAGSVDDGSSSSTSTTSTSTSVSGTSSPSNSNPNSQSSSPLYRRKYSESASKFRLPIAVPSQISSASSGSAVGVQSARMPITATNSAYPISQYELNLLSAAASATNPASLVSAAAGSASISQRQPPSLPTGEASASQTGSVPSETLLYIPHRSNVIRQPRAPPRSASSAVAAGVPTDRSAIPYGPPAPQSSYPQQNLPYNNPVPNPQQQQLNPNHMQPRRKSNRNPPSDTQQ